MMSKEAARVLAQHTRDESESWNARLAAANALLDRVFGESKERLQPDSEKGPSHKDK